MTRPLLRDLYAVLAAALLVTAAVLVGRHIQHSHHTLFVNWPPLLGTWSPHVGPGTPAAVLVAAAGVAYGPALAARLPWRALLATAWATATAWTVSLALIDGWQRGIAGRLTTPHEYLRVVDRFDDIPATLRDFTHHILIDSPDNWPAHVAGHPPGATLTFVLLDRIGLRGGGWAGVWCIAVGATACVAVLVAVRALAGESLARRAAPFLVLAPAAVWMGTSADAYFAAVAAWAVALLALAVSGRSWGWAAAAGLLFGLTCYLSYGLTLVALIGAAVLLLGRRRVRERPVLLVPLLAGLAVVPAAFTLAGFDWWEAYRLLVTRYHQGVGGIRPYGYWVWANLACAVLITGLATAPGLRRTGAVLVRRRTEHPDRVGLALLVSAALLALLIADLSGMSKAETERIWLPFAVWLLPACAFLTRPRAWLAAQALLALLLNHVLRTGW
ncbi:membrane protein [Streptomyces viridochromogenes]|uniref:Membrane protein n=1 Tax=Streptomyces viridochromogenes TaxID=1938 RepID=A0A0J7ZAS3_STRVR|nr:glycosyltransferase family 39 protein [Streptomyces viridochromogenes]KMS72924.1 membrane protein [Streptomyces viridochromogenes]KOG14671.1 membrane protein [Streptomyces viridochromogenes]KOG24146.1 membrane protein [Streptomyces viridochromogenes]